MANEFNSKITLSTGEVLIDLTQDDIKPEHVQKDIYFHDKTGRRQQGTNTKTVDASEATAEAAEVLAGRTFGKGEEMQTGTMPDRSGTTVEVSSLGGAPIPSGFHDASSKAVIAPTEAAKLIASNIKEGVSILGVVGSFGADDISSQEKTVEASFEDQTVVPDANVSFLSSVLVKAIKVTRTDNEAGGVTVTIG